MKPSQGLFFINTKDLMRAEFWVGTSFSRKLHNYVRSFWLDCELNKFNMSSLTPELTFSDQRKIVLKIFVWILFPEMTLGDTPKISFSQKCRKSLRIYNYGFCFRKWRSMTLPNGPGFCFQKWRSVRYPDFWLFSTLTFNIVTWWRHTCDVTSCTYTLTDTLSATYDVTLQSSCVTS